MRGIERLMAEKKPHVGESEVGCGILRSALHCPRVVTGGFSGVAEREQTAPEMAQDNRVFRVDFFRLLPFRDGPCVVADVPQKFRTCIAHRDIARVLGDERSITFIQLSPLVGRRSSGRECCLHQLCGLKLFRNAGIARLLRAPVRRCTEEKHRDEGSDQLTVQNFMHNVGAQFEGPLLPCKNTVAVVV